MDQIRFNKPIQTAPIAENFPAPQPERRGARIWKWLFLLVVLIFISVAVFFFYKINGGGASKTPLYYNSEASPYYAVFLDNGQVYFGKPLQKTQTEFVISDVYYLQLSGGENDIQAGLQNPKFTLIKLGEELHGPTDMLIIETGNILFYEQLKNDSEVVKSILSR